MAARFWVGGTGTWDNAATTNWSTSSGGAGGASVPGASDDITFDGSSGGGTVTAAANISGLTFNSITMGAFTGTLDFSVNNPSLTMGSFSGTGSATRTLKLGTGTFTITATGSAWNFATITNLTFTGSSATISLTSSATSTVTFAGGGLTYGTLSLGTSTNGHVWLINNGNTFSTISIASPNRVQFNAAVTQTITNAPAWTGTTANPIEITSASNGSAATISVSSGTASCAWCVLANLHATGGATFNATNSFNLGDNTGWIITNPSSGGGSIIG